MRACTLMLMLMLMLMLTAEGEMLCVQLQLTWAVPRVGSVRSEKDRCFQTLFTPCAR